VKIFKLQSDKIYFPSKERFSLRKIKQYRDQIRNQPRNKKLTQYMNHRKNNPETETEAEKKTQSFNIQSRSPI